MVCVTQMSGKIRATPWTQSRKRKNGRNTKKPSRIGSSTSKKSLQKPSFHPNFIHLDTGSIISAHHQRRHALRSQVCAGPIRSTERRRVVKFASSERRRSVRYGSILKFDQASAHRGKVAASCRGTSRHRGYKGRAALLAPRTCWPLPRARACGTAATAATFASAESSGFTACATGPGMCTRTQRVSAGLGRPGLRGNRPQRARLRPQPPSGERRQAFRKDTPTMRARTAHADRCATRVQHDPCPRALRRRSAPSAPARPRRRGGGRTGAHPRVEILRRRAQGTRQGRAIGARRAGARGSGEGEALGAVEHGDAEPLLEHLVA
jgi:hypothetical protein